MPHRFAQLAELLDALHCGAAVIDRDGKMFYINSRMADWIGGEKNALIGTSLMDIYSQQADQEKLKYMLEHFDQPASGEFHIPQPDGSRLTVVFTGRPIIEDNKPPVMRVITGIDISHQKEAYRHISQLSDTVLEQAIELKHYARRLEQRVRQRTAELHDANLEAITMLALASEAKDDDTGRHIIRIQHYTEAVALRMGLPELEAEQMGKLAILHDVGKMKIPDHILKKPGPLTDNERRDMQQHTIFGERILSTKPFFETARQIARSHHENFDGSGYPDALKNDQIPLAARIVHTVDVYDALVNPRIYKQAWPRQRALDTITRNTGTQFDPDVTHAFLNLHKEGRICNIARNINNNQSHYWH